MKKIAVAIIDDSPFMRKVLERVIDSDPDMKVAGSFGSGQELLSKIKTLKADVLLMDYNMPILDGIETLRRVAKVRPMPTVFLTAYIDHDTEEALRAYEAGALAIVAKPGEIGESLKNVSGKLSKEIKAAAKADPKKIKGFIETTLKAILRREKIKSTFPVVAVGASTGGPALLEELIPKLPADFRGAVLIAQHMPEDMSRILAYRLAKNSKIQVKEAEDGEAILPGAVYIAPARKHLLVEIGAGGGGSVFLKSEDSYFGTAPSIDMLFESAARLYGKKLIGAVLTGTGRDGLVGAKMIKELGGRVWVQDEKTAAAPNMPHEIISHGLADLKLSPADLAKKIAGL